MSYPAFTDFFADPERTMSRVCVYMALQPPFLSHAEPRPAKVEAVQFVARVSKAATAEALTWLICRGYLVVHNTDRHGSRTVTLAWERSEAAKSASVLRMDKKQA